MLERNVIDHRYHPTRAVRNGHFQTVYPALFGSSPQVPVSATWYVPVERGVLLHGKFTASTQSDRLAVLYHGLGGSVESAQVRRLAMSIHVAGYNVLRMTLRGFETEPPFSPTLFHAGRTDDVEKTVDFARAKGFCSIHLFGISLGGSLLLRWLSQGIKKIDSVFALCPPLDLNEAVLRLDSKEAMIYRTYFLKMLKENILRKARTFPDIFARYLRNTFASIRGFDQEITAPFYGFHNVNEYYDDSSALSRLHRIQNRTLIVQAEDDPIVRPAPNAYEKSRLSPSIQYKVFSTGGHAGFLESLDTRSAVETWAVDFFNACPINVSV